MRLHSVLLAGVVVLCAAPRVFAEPIIITGGLIDLGSPSSPNNPPFGFSLIGEQTNIGGVTFEQGLSPVSAGQVVSFSTMVNLSKRSNEGPFEETVQGVTLTDVQLQGMLSFVSPPVIIPGDPGRDINAPFTMTGSLSFFRSGSPGQPFLTVDVMGSGRVFMDLIPTDQSGLFLSAGTLYRFEPASSTETPEPGTMLLIGSGLIAVGRRLRTRKV